MRPQARSKTSWKDRTPTFDRFTTLVLIVLSAVVAGAMCARGEAGVLKGFSPDVATLDGSFPDAMTPLLGP